ELDHWIDGESRESKKLIARRAPNETPTATNPQREFQTVKALEGLIPIPKAYWIDEHGRNFGQPTQIYSFEKGVQKPSEGYGNASGIGTYFPAALRPGLSANFVDILATIHRYEPDPAAFPAFDVPKVGTNEGTLRTVNWWARVWEEDRMEDVPLMAMAENWLRANAPPLDRISIVHGDYRSGNFLFDESQAKITAILDWELSYLGDRHADLAWAMFDSFATDGEKGERLMSGLLPKDEFIARYEATSGFSIDPKRLAYFGILELWKGVVLTGASSARASNGLKTHQNILLAWCAALAYPMMESLRRLLTAELAR
ncbi:MAG: phosphotransferase family protein, partial [Actinomycetes bacterium]